MIKIEIKRISRRLKNLREEKQLTQEELAERLGISRQSIISVEHGKCLPSLPLALRIADIFDATFEEIFNPEQNPSTGGEKEGEKMMPQFITPWSPFGDLDPFFEEDETNFRPAVNVRQTEKEIILIADIPGVKDDEMQIEVGQDFVDISGERKEEEKEEKEGYFRQEVHYGAFSRRISLPAEVIADNAEATIKNGQLKLVVPKAEIAKPKTTKIKVKKS